MYTLGKNVNPSTRRRFAQIVSRLRAGRTIREFAKVIGVSHPTISDWEDENSSSVPHAEGINKVAQLCGMRVPDFLAHLEDEGEFNPIESAIAQINGASPQQLAQVLRAIANRIERSS